MRGERGLVEWDMGTLQWSGVALTTPTTAACHYAKRMCGGYEQWLVVSLLGSVAVYRCDATENRIFRFRTMIAMPFMYTDHRRDQRRSAKNA